MKILLFQVDGKIPNLALMRIAAHHRQLGDEVVLRSAENAARTHPQFGDSFHKIYASAIFQRSRRTCELIQSEWEGVIIGGTGWSLETTTEQYGISTNELEWSLYPDFPNSIGFTQRGCRMSCEFCVVPRKEGHVQEAATITEIWRGEPHPRNVILLDNDFFGQARWRDRIRELIDGHFRVSFNQGINARCITDEAAEAVASVDYYDDQFSQRRIYTAWDNRDDEDRLFSGLNRLVKYGVKPSAIMVYMLIGFWPDETQADREYRRKRLRDFGAIPFPMSYRKTPELIQFQRWVIRAWDKVMPWDLWLDHQRNGLRKVSELPTLPITEGVNVT
jgi:hypothetical protein